MTKKNKVTLAIAVVVVIIVGAFYMNYQNTHLSGTYKADVKAFGFTAGSASVSFNGDKYTSDTSALGSQVDSGKGTYTVSGNKLTLQDGSDKNTVTLSGDHKSFTVDGTTFTKQ